MEELFQEATDIGHGYVAITLALYDAETAVLVLDQHATAPEETGVLQTLPAPRRILDTVQSRSQALRSAIIQADHWIGIVRGSVASA